MIIKDRKIELKNLPEFIKLSELSQLLRISPLTLKRWGKAGKIKFIRINTRGDRRFRKEDVINFIQSKNEF